MIVAVLPPKKCTMQQYRTFSLNAKLNDSSYCSKEVEYTEVHCCGGGAVEINISKI